MEITKSLAGFLESRLISLRLTNGDMVFGVFDELSGSDIILEKPDRINRQPYFSRTRYNKDEVVEIKYENDNLRIAHALNVGLKFSKRVRQALETKCK